MKSSKIFFIDPQSYHNLSAYDYSILSRITDKEFVFLCSDKYDYKPLPSNVKKIPIYNYSNYKNKLIKTFWYIINCLTLIYYAIKYKPKLAHIQWIRFYPVDIIVLRLLKSVLKIKLVYTVHDILPKDNPDEKAKRRFTKLYKYCNILIAHTKKTKKELESFGIEGSKIIIMPHGPLHIEADKKDIDEAVICLKKQFNIKEHDKVVSVIGGGTWFKGTDLGISAWTNTKGLKENNTFHLIVIGRDTAQYLPSNPPMNMHNISRIFSNAEYCAVLKISSLILIPYRIIDQSGILLSVVFEKIPYCCTDVGELAEPIKISKVGWVAPEVSPNAIGQTVLEALESPDLERIRGNNELWNSIIKNYDWDNSAKILNNCYNQLIKTL